MSGVRNPSGLCMCGCGRKTRVLQYGTPGYKKGESVRFIKGHGQPRRTDVPDEPANPSGLCMCGCGGKTALAHCNMSGYRRGHPKRFIEGHNAYKTGPRWLEEDRGHATPCWIWQLYKDPNGYGRSSKGDSRGVLAHRLVYEEQRGAIPAGLDLDHLCRVTSCVNPSHLEAVTHKVNMLRGVNPPAQNALKTHCKRGHPFDAENTHYTPAGKRRCRTCDRAYVRRQRERRAA